MEGRGLWKNTNLEHLLVPLDAELSDYVFNVAQLLGELSKIEQRPVRQVYEDVIATSSDTIRIRMLEVEDDGTLGLDRGIAALTSARDMMLAAACETAGTTHQGRVSLGG